MIHVVLTGYYNEVHEVASVIASENKKVFYFTDIDGTSWELDANSETIVQFQRKVESLSTPLNFIKIKVTKDSTIHASTVTF